MPEDSWNGLSPERRTRKWWRRRESRASQAGHALREQSSLANPRSPCPSWAWAYLENQNRPETHSPSSPRVLKNRPGTGPPSGFNITPILGRCAGRQLVCPIAYDSSFFRCSLPEFETLGGCRLPDARWGYARVDLISSRLTASPLSATRSGRTAEIESIPPSTNPRLYAPRA